jgi:hypothetical protein
MDYQHKIIQNHPRITIWKFERDIPYIPNVGDLAWFPEKWKYGEQFIITSVHHYFIDKLIVINVNKA